MVKCSSMCPELLHFICLVSIFLVLFDLKEFDLIYFFFQFSRLSIYIKTVFISRLLLYLDEMDIFSKARKCFDFRWFVPNVFECVSGLWEKSIATPYLYLACLDSYWLIVIGCGWYGWLCTFQSTNVSWFDCMWGYSSYIIWS